MQTPTKENEKNTKARTFEGVVVSDSMQKTRVVRTTRIMKDKRYRKYHRVHKKFKIHDEENVSKVGDQVLFQEDRPLSKEKRWSLVKVIQSSQENSV